LVRWQFAPESRVKILGERRFSVRRADIAIVIEVDSKWAEVKLAEPVTDKDPRLPSPGIRNMRDLEGMVSPAFRKACVAPYLLLAAPRTDKTCVFRTTFLTSEA
jgi:hypothetical protein